MYCTVYKHMVYTLQRIFQWYQTQTTCIHTHFLVIMHQCTAALAVQQSFALSTQHTVLLDKTTVDCMHTETILENEKTTAVTNETPIKRH